MQPPAELVTIGKSYWYIAGKIHDIVKEAGEQVDHLEFFLAAGSERGKELFELDHRDLKALRRYQELGAPKPCLLEEPQIQKALAKIDRKAPVQMRIFPDFVVMVLYGRNTSVHTAQDALIATERYFPDETVVSLCVGGGWSVDDHCFRTTYGDIMEASSLRDLI